MGQRYQKGGRLLLAARESGSAAETGAQGGLDEEEKRTKKGGKLSKWKGIRDNVAKKEQ